MLFADVIVDISHEHLDKTYQYIVKPEQEETVKIGACVTIPFGRGSRLINGYIVNLTKTPAWELDKMKPIEAINEDRVAVESQFIYLAYWMKENYGGTMNEALKTVLPVKKAVKHTVKKYIYLQMPADETREALETFRKRGNKGRVRLLEALLENPALSASFVKETLHISAQTINDLIKLSLIREETEIKYRNPVKEKERDEKPLLLNEEQQAAANGILADYRKGLRNTYLLHGITGSGKTEVYMEVIEGVLQEGRQIIMLIPEIALTYQTVLRFYRRFGERISILHSRMSKGERYDQYNRAKNGEIDIMIGPRSALFTPFLKLGLIIIDEEQEGSYKSEGTPKYHARETAIERAKISRASVILGSATPSVESYYKAKTGEYTLYRLKNRAGEASLPKIEVVDLRDEFKKKNKSIFSRRLRQLMENNLKKKEQTMLFINRRGYAGFVSCRSCGHVLKCSHCDISLTAHNNGRLVCHYCGYEIPAPKLCPECGSPYIAAFGVGTQKIEAMVKKEFPGARVLRMDADTTGGKDGHQKILSAFARREADILIGTQMIVKGHDFPGVTLVGVLAADLSLYAGDYRASERTFELLTQAAGRAGRGDKPGEVVIQTYNPEHYSVRFAAQQDYEGFYEQEAFYRSMLDYPPAGHLTAILISSESEQMAVSTAGFLGKLIKEKIAGGDAMKIIGPSRAALFKANDIYRMALYLKDKNDRDLKDMAAFLQDYIRNSGSFQNVMVSFDFDPVNNY